MNWKFKSKVQTVLAAMPSDLSYNLYFKLQRRFGGLRSVNPMHTFAKGVRLRNKITELGQSVNGKTILEIGTGSGYQTSILAQLTPKVFSVERIKSLQFQAKRKLQAMDLHNISMKHGDGWQGWKSKAPFQAIIVTAAPTEIPQALLEQLADGGRLVIPVGEQTQILKIITRNGDTYDERQIEAVRFVPLVSGSVQ